jgi:RimJ/RimL family protein N-acetyltransferase
VDILSAVDVDLICPFPMTALNHLCGWMRAHKSFVETDLTGHTPEDYARYFQELLPYAYTYGVIDRANVLGFKHEMPIIGMVSVQPDGPWNAKLNFACNRRALGRYTKNTNNVKIWEAGFMDQAVAAASNQIFEMCPELLRLSGMTLVTNSPVRQLYRRLGWGLEGQFDNAAMVGGVPKSVVHYGLLRPAKET